MPLSRKSNLARLKGNYLLSELNNYFGIMLNKKMGIITEQNNRFNAHDKTSIS